MNTRMIQRRKWGKKELLAFKKGVIFAWKRLAKLADRYYLQGKGNVFNQYFRTDIEFVIQWMIATSDSIDLGPIPMSRYLHQLHLISQKIEQTLNEPS